MTPSAESPLDGLLRMASRLVAVIDKAFFPRRMAPGESIG